MSQTYGIFQSDVIIRSALIEAIADLRKNPWLLDYVFLGLAKDTVTAKRYGQKQMAEAKKWLMETNVPVYIATANTDDAKFPSITIALSESGEADTTLGDVHYDPTEPVEGEDPVLAGPFAPVSYSPLTSIMRVPQEVVEGLSLLPGMVVQDAGGKRHSVTAVENDAITLSPGGVGNFGSVTLHYGSPAYLADLESVTMKESYVIGCHVSTLPLHLIFLHSIVVFCLLRYKQSLLEGRGFERSQFSSSDFSRYQQFDPEAVWSRYITITGYVRQFWPKSINPAIQEVQSRLRVIDGAHVPTELQHGLWVGDLDDLTNIDPLS